MNKKTAAFVIALAVWGAATARADFKYTESAKVTGGMMAGMTKMAAVFSKEARQAANQPTVTTTAVKGNRLRTDEADGNSKVIDLDGRRIITIDNKARTYSILTFEQMRAALERAMAQAQAQPKGNPQNPNVKMTPKVETSATGSSKTILEVPASEYKVRMDMEMQTDDPRAKGQTASFWFTSDTWTTTAVKGYEEVRDFHRRMAREFDWVPGAMFGGNVQMSPAAAEFRKQSAEMKGFPLLQYTSMGMGGAGAAGQGQSPPSSGGAPTQQPSSQPAASQPQSTPQMTNPTQAIVKGLLGGFGRKKKQQQQAEQEQPSAAAPPAGQAPPGPSNSPSLADMTMEVTSFSSDSLDSSLFAPPAGYTEVKANPDEMLGSKKK